MKNKQKLFSNFLPIILAVLLLLFDSTQVTAYTLIPAKLRTFFGGKILVKSREVCMLPAPPPIFTVPLPFVYYEIGPPVPAKLYYVYGVSKTYRRYQREETAWSLGTHIPGVNKFKELCLNRAFLPEADGVIRKIGTSCIEGETRCE